MSAQLLNAFIEARRHTEFQWGVHDCCLFAADWALLFTGQDPAADLRGTYGSALTAKRLLDRAGGVVSLADKALLRCGWVPTPPTKAQRGSIAALGPPDSASLGVIIHPGVVGPGPCGLVFLPRSVVTHTWTLS
jgi:hypothetical protein